MRREGKMPPALTEAVVLAGGLGTRLRQAVPDLPKPMAPVAGKPFLSYQLEWLRRQGIRRAVLSVGYRHEVISENFGAAYGDLAIEYSIEEAPLGTGGGTLAALDHVSSPDVLLLNGDTFFSVDFQALWEAHVGHRADVTMALRRLADTGRYGPVDLDRDGRVTRFRERGNGGPGLINGGIYMISVETLRDHAPAPPFSLEKDFLEKHVQRLQVVGVPFDAFFIDIGTPEDFDRAQHELPRHL